jgi:excisionase family DNA binding protein
LESAFIHSPHESHKTEGDYAMLDVTNGARATKIPRISLTPDEAASSTGFSRTRIYNAIRDEELTARKDGRATVIEVAELQRWVRSMPTRGRAPDEMAAA